MRTRMVRVSAAAVLAMALGGAWALHLLAQEGAQDTAQQAAQVKEKPKGKIEAVTEKPASEVVLGQALSRLSESVREKKETLSLEEMLAQALKNHPEVRIAEAKVREAEAEVDRARLQVTQKVIAAYRAIETERALVRDAETRHSHQVSLVSKGFASKSDLANLQTVLADRKAKLAELEMELPYLLGRPSQTQSALRHLARAYQVAQVDDLATQQSATRYVSALSTQRLLRSRLAQSGQEPIREPMADRIRKGLDTPVGVQYKDKPLTEVLKDLEKQVPGVPFVPHLGSHQEVKVTVELAERVPLAAALQALEDISGIRFGIREYGILAFGPTRAVDGWVSPQDFWKQPPAVKWLAKEVQGEVKAVDEKNGLIQINIGSDAGLEKGHTLEVYRLKPKPKYLGPIRLLEVKEKESVGKPMGNLKDPMQVGDQVSSSPQAKD